MMLSKGIIAFRRGKVLVSSRENIDPRNLNEKRNLALISLLGELGELDYYISPEVLCRLTIDDMEEIHKNVLPYMQAQKRGKIIFTSSGVGVTGFIGISPYASTKGALESLAKCLNIEYASDDISFHIIHPPLTRTNSAAPLPVPKEFMADPQKVGYGIAKHIFSKRFIICHNLSQKLQTLICYLFPIKMGRLISKMAIRYINNQRIE